MKPISLFFPTFSVFMYILCYIHFFEKKMWVRVYIWFDCFFVTIILLLWSFETSKMKKRKMRNIAFQLYFKLYNPLLDTFCAFAIQKREKRKDIAYHQQKRTLAWEILFYSCTVLSMSNRTFYIFLTKIICNMYRKRKVERLTNTKHCTCTGYTKVVASEKITESLQIH